MLDKSLWENFVEQYRSNVDDCDKEWRCEYFSKMMRGAALTYQYTKSKELYNTLKDAVTDMLSTQDNLGRFSTYSVEAEFDGWDLWGRKYVMIGFNDSENIIDLAYEKAKAPYQFKYTKAYEMMSCFQGLLENYRVTKCDKHLQAGNKTQYMLIAFKIIIYPNERVNHLATTLTLS